MEEGEGARRRKEEEGRRGDDGGRGTRKRNKEEGGRGEEAYLVSDYVL